MIGHESAGPLRACVKVPDCCDSSSAGTLTCVKMLEKCIRARSVLLALDWDVSLCKKGE
jgi:hypothetical protein